ncbi:MAG: conjugal transfer protein TraI [Dyadobacter sp. 50-39]|uniref:conjugal transfer protein TraI n=1 Tax=Dyadobacter sp. 50-39 TaxID=1895756 RepID=UPI000964CCA3|nr:conjugal transfer protein TraI [Dyadobacter sp. 50-39]OJV19772.1 MAG: conjugal transfer protein TraI [Dyadobacter sp. 50-39]
MKKYVIFILILSGTLAPVQNAEAANPWAAIIKAAIKKVVKAVDLMIQRRQNRVIKLQNAQKALENTMAKLKLEQIADWVKKQRDLYRQYYEELKKVKAVIAYYFRVKEIAEKNSRLVDEYRRVWGLLQNDENFTAQELAYIHQVYVGILETSAKNLDLLAVIVKSFTTQMSDAKRLEIIEKAGRQVDENLSDLTTFNRENVLLSVSRTKTAHEARVVRELYGIQ